MAFLEKFKPTIKFLTLFGICLFRIDGKSNELKLWWLTSLYGLVCAMGYTISLSCTTYAIYFYDKTIADIFPNILKICVLMVVLCSNVLFFLEITNHVKNTLTHITLLRHLNAIDVKIIQIWNEDSYVRCYILPIVVVLQIKMTLNLKYWLNLEFTFHFAEFIFCGFYLCGIFSTYIIMIYVRYICLVMISLQRKLVGHMQLELSDGLTVKSKWMQILAICDDFSGLQMEFYKTFSALLGIVLTINYLYIFLSLYLSGYRFRRGELFAAFYYLFNNVVVSILVIVCMVVVIVKLAKQVNEKLRVLLFNFKHIYLVNE